MNWYSYRHRNGDPAIGRFFGVDPVSEEYMSISTYQFAHNNPVWKVEIEGLEGKETQGKDLSNYEPIKVVNKPVLGFVGGGLVEVKLVQQGVKEVVKEVAVEATERVGNVVIKTLAVVGALLKDYMSPNMGGRTSEMQFTVDHKIKGDNVETSVISQPYNSATKDSDGDVIYRGGAFTDSNFTPRPGKDDGTGPKSGLSTNVDPLSATQGQGGKAQALSANSLKGMGFQLTKTPDGHVGVRPPSQGLLQKWAESRGDTSGLNPSQILTQMVKSARIEEVKVPKL